MTEMMLANFHEGDVVKIVWPVVKLATDKWLDFSKLRDELAESNSKLEDSEEARHRSETQKRNITYVLLFLLGALLVGSIFFTITPRSRLLTA
jgi:hypothetical protein